MKKLNNDATIPLYKQVAVILLGEIRKRTYLHGDKIPVEPELCDSFGVSRITIRKAVNQLQEQGVLEKRSGKGTYVCYPKIVEASDADGSFTRSSEMINRVHSTNIVGYEVIPVDDVTRFNLREVFPEEDEVIIVERVRTTDGEPMIMMKLSW